MTEKEIEWATGIVEVLGSFLIVKTSGTTSHAVRYVARTSKHTEALERLADLIGVNVTSVQQGKTEALQIVIQGKTLHRFMTDIWKSLTPQRKLEYATARKALRVKIAED